MAAHFEEIWVNCENFHKESGVLSNDVQNLLEELILKINLYKTMDAKGEIPVEDQQKVKSRLMGEILLTLTGLSFKDDINVYDSLNIALQYRSLVHHGKKKST